MATALSFLDLARGVGKGHRAIAATPGAQRISPQLRAAQKNELPDAIIEQYNNAGIFGKTARGEPIRATMSSTDEDAVRRGQMPHTGKLRLDPESKVPKSIDEAHASGRHPHITWSPSRVRAQQEPLASGIQRYMVQNALRNPSSMSPIMTDLYAMNVKPDTFGLTNPDAAWWENLPSKGKEMYALVYDMMRAQGHGNAANTLTDVNTARRLGNVASHSLGHGDLGYIAPVNELAYMPGESAQLFNRPVQSGQSEGFYLQKLFGGPGLKRDRNTDRLVNEAFGLRTPDFLKMSPDETIGTLFTREAQLAGAYGPDTGSASPLRFSQVRPYENAQLRALAEPHVTANLEKIEGAMGPTTLGRQATTEAIIRGMLKGYDVDEIIERLIGDAPPDGYKGRYKEGGLAHAAVCS